jgi:hypothetical protein
MGRFEPARWDWLVAFFRRPNGWGTGLIVGQPRPNGMNCCRKGRIQQQCAMGPASWRVYALAAHKQGKGGGVICSSRDGE